MINHEDIFRTGIALLAFVVAFYAVIARERKTPYILNSIYAITFVVLIALLLSLTSKILEPNSEGNTSSMLASTNAPAASGTNVAAIAAGTSSLATGVTNTSITFTKPSSQAVIAKYLNWAAVSILGIGIIFIFYRVWRIQNRQVNFRDDQLRYTIPCLLWLRKRKQRERKQKAYEHNALHFSPELLASLKKSDVLPEGKLERAITHHGESQRFSTSVAVLTPTHMDADSVMADLAIRFLDNGCYVQYTTCSRHPIEFLLHLKSKWLKDHPGEDWKKIKDRVVLVDGYTPHFGFTDTVYTEWSATALEDCLDCINSPPSFAGVHTAIANGFNKIKKEQNEPKLREPQIYIYEGLHALVDLESNEQYRIFLRHVIPSERLWGGMLTLFVESWVSQDNLSVLKEITHIFVDRTKATETQNPDK